MARITSPAEDARLLPETIQSVIEAWIARSSGLALIGLCAIGWISIITWSNVDPSLTQTMAGPTRNLLGPLGAIIADLLLQTLGIAALFGLAGPLVLGLELSSARRIPNLATKLIVFPVAVLVLAGGLSGLPTLPSWPLHHGFGGLIGDFVYNMLASLLTLVGAERAGMLTGLGLLTGGLAALVHGLGLSFGDLIASHARSQPREQESPQPNAFEPSLRVETSNATAAPLFEPNLAPLHADRGPDLLDEGLLLAVEPDRGHHPDDASVTAEEHEHLMAEDDPVNGDARSFAKRFAPAGVAIPKPDRQEARLDAGARQLPAMLRGFSPARTQGWRRPALGLLQRGGPTGREPTTQMLHERAGALTESLADFGVHGEIRGVRAGPVVTSFEFQPARGIKTARVIALADDIARAMGAKAARVATRPGRTTIGIELPNAERRNVMLRDVLDSDAYRSAQITLPLALGCSIDGEPIVADLAAMPHLLVAGTTGSGKSVGINTMILSLLYRHSPKDCRLLLIDPKMLDLCAYDGIPHLLTPVVTDAAQAVAALARTVEEMDERYKRMARLGVRNIEAFNNRIEHAASRGERLERTVQTGFDPRTGQPIFEREPLAEEPMPHIVVVIDEFADLMMTAGRSLEASVTRLAQKARAAGIHLVLATQRPTVDIVTGTIKANIPTRIAYRVASKVDSRCIMGEPGAEQLLGAGDMLLIGGTGQPLRVHGAFVGAEEIERVAASLKAQGGPEYDAALVPPAVPDADPEAGRRRRKKR